MAVVESAKGRDHGGSDAGPKSGLAVDTLLELGLAATAPPRIEGYRMLRPLGSGGMGEVFLAVEEALGRRVAIKVLGGRSRSDAALEEMRTRFRREARIMAAIEHPHIVRLYRIGRTVDGRDYLAMHYVEGQSLAERLDASGPLPPTEALRVTRQTVLALGAAWRKGVVHRDVKPSNLLLDREGQVLVADFGLARGPARTDEVAELTHAGSLVGTPTYLSPEQARGEVIDFRSDLYALGIVLFEMLVGDPPFTSGSLFEVVSRHLYEELPALPPSVPSRLARLVRWLTRKDPAARPGSHDELLAAIDRAWPPPTVARPAAELPSGPPSAGPFRERSVDTPTPTLLFASTPRWGALVPKRCDRSRQMAALVSARTEHVREREAWAQAFLVHGETGGCHGSLVERFLTEHVTREPDTGGRVGIVHRRLSWPVGAGVLEGRTALVADLFAAVDPLHPPPDLGAQALVRLPALARTATLVVEHEVRAPRLGRRDLALIDWYVNDFWTSCGPLDGPRVLVFLDVILPARPRWARLRRLLTPAGRTERRLERRLSRGRTPSPAVVTTLGPVTPAEVVEWLSLHGLGRSERERHDLARRIFTTDDGIDLDALPMAEVEYELARLHATYREADVSHPHPPRR